MKTTKTNGRLHFEDLDPLRFEDLSLSMVYRLNRWEEIHHFGRSGNDEGIDIQAVEELENGKRRTWFIQCKRYKNIANRGIKAFVDEIIKKSNTAPDILLLVVSCDLSKKTIEFYHRYAKEQGIPNPQVWSASVIEAKLYAEHHDLLFAYFGINLSLERGNRITTVRRNINLKHRMRDDFIKKKLTHSEIKHKYDKFIHSESIIHSIDDFAYPDIDENSIGISSWFKIELYDFYFNGLEVILAVEECIIDEQGYWDIVEYNDNLRKNNYETRHALVIGRIPYENIIDYDFDGDEFYGCPHIYCDFKNNGEPYEEIKYYLASETNTDGYSYDWPLDNTKRKNLT